MCETVRYTPVAFFGQKFTISVFSQTQLAQDFHPSRQTESGLWFSPTQQRHLRVFFVLTHFLQQTRSCENVWRLSSSVSLLTAGKAPSSCHRKCSILTLSTQLVKVTCQFNLSKVSEILPSPEIPISTDFCCPVPFVNSFWSVTELLTCGLITYIAVSTMCSVVISTCVAKFHSLRGTKNCCKKCPNESVLSYFKITSCHALFVVLKAKGRHRGRQPILLRNFGSKAAPSSVYFSPRVQRAEILQTWRPQLR